MTSRPCSRVLIIEKDPRISEKLARQMRLVTGLRLETEIISDCDEGLVRLARNDIDLVILCLTPPETEKLEFLHRAQRINPHLPVVLHKPDEDEYPTIQEVNTYYLTGRTDSEFLEFAVRFTMDLHHSREQFRLMSLTDDLTGLSNRRAFFSLASQRLKLLKRAGKGALLLFVDVDDLKFINDTFGHPAGDTALKDAAEILRQTFRDSDIVARIGGDEFVVVAGDVIPAAEPVLLKRLELTLDDYVAITDRSFLLGLSVGTAYLDPANPVSLELLIAQADQALYARKRRKTAFRRPTGSAKAV